MSTTAARPPAEPPPELSVVVASVNGWSTLGPTLRSIDEQPGRDRIEVVVVDKVGGATRDQILAHRPPVALVAVDDRRSIPRLRYLGVQRSRGALVAIVEDHAAVSKGWAAGLIEAHRGPWGAVAGTVENGNGGLVNWAAFLCEYTPYMGPVAEGEAVDLPGNNVAYKRPHLLRHAHHLDEGRWESWINAGLRADGVPTATTNRAPVRHIKPFRLDDFLVQRFHFSRSYAGMRRPEQSPLKRLVYGVGSLALPILLTARVARNGLAKRRHLGKLAVCLPLIGVFFAVGAAGEMLGYLVGPGDSLDRVA